MTVAELIQKLKKMPAKAPVYLADHDHADDEYNGPLARVTYQNGSYMLDDNLHQIQTVVILRI